MKIITKSEKFVEWKKNGEDRKMVFPFNINNI